MYFSFYYKKNVYLCILFHITKILSIMKKVGTIIIVLMLGGMVSAQTSMRVPHGSFEQWITHPAYNISVSMLTVPVYDSYSTPTGWENLAYPINESFSFLGMPVNVNTSLPLVKVSQETGSVPDSSSAVKLQTFMLSDVVGSLVYALAATELDTMLTTTVFPSILATGQVDLDHFIPIMTGLLGDMDSVESLLASLATMDVNYLITGGIALGDFEPSRLTGSYKYHSADSGDNGGVLMLGTRYNTTTHQREVVGGGANIELTDAVNYSPFTVDYVSLHELDASFAEQTPDSLIVLLISSASENRQQGSYLCVDNLQLWQDSIGVSEPDTCASIVGLTAVADIHEARLEWGTTAAVDGYELEYGVAGFVQGSGTMIYPTGDTAELTGLAANTAYDVYLRAVCNATIYGEWASVSFTTQPDTCASVRWMEAVSVVYDAFPMYALHWVGSSQPDHWEVEYGLQGFALGSGTVVETNGTSFAIYELEEQGLLQPNTWYDFYVRSVCEGGIYGEWDSVQYRTFCAQVSELTVAADSLWYTADSLVGGYRVQWVDPYNEQWTVEYGPTHLDGPFEWRGTVVTVNEPQYQLPPLQPDLAYTVVVWANCGDDNIGDSRWVDFHTASLPVGIAQVDPAVLMVSPNPAEGRCVVRLKGVESAEVELFDSEGRKIQAFTYKGVPVELQLPSKGVYLLRATTQAGIVTRKVVAN